MSRSYAQGTSSTVMVSQADIMKVLARFGVLQHAFYNDHDKSAIGFAYGGLTYRIEVIMPPRDHEMFCFTESGKARTEAVAAKAYDDETKRRWRSLLLVIKAKLVAVDDGIATFEQEFLAYIVTGDNRLFGDYAIPQIKELAAGGKAPSALPMPGRSK